MTHEDARNRQHGRVEARGRQDRFIVESDLAPRRIKVDLGEHEEGGRADSRRADEEVQLGSHDRPRGVANHDNGVHSPQQDVRDAGAIEREAAGPRRVDEDGARPEELIGKVDLDRANGLDVLRVSLLLAQGERFLERDDALNVALVLTCQDDTPWLLGILIKGRDGGRQVVVDGCDITAEQRIDQRTLAFLELADDRYEGLRPSHAAKVDTQAIFKIGPVIGARSQHREFQRPAGRDHRRIGYSFGIGLFARRHRVTRRGIRASRAVTRILHGGTSRHKEAHMSYALGIDLGTTYSAAATAEHDRADIFQLGSHSATIPSVVFLREDAVLLTGDAAARRGASEPARAAREFKRRLGDPTPYILGGTPFGAEALMAEMLRAIVAHVTEERGEAPATVAVTHPGSYGPYKLDLLRQAARQAGLDHVEFLAEPIAAASHYALQERIPAGSIIAVYDFGGGTFDAAVLRKTEDGFDLLGQPEGLERLGGIDFDEAVFSHVAETVGRDVLAGDGSLAVRAGLIRLREECREAKESLSDDTEATIAVLLPGIQRDVRLTRSQFEEAIRPRIRETVAALERSIRSAGLELAQVDRILLVGGTSRIPLVGQTVRELTGRPVTRDAHPKHGIALGAALMAGKMAQMGGASAGPVTPRIAPAPASPEIASPAPAEAPVIRPNRPAEPRRVAAATTVAAPVRGPGPARSPEAPDATGPSPRGRRKAPRWAWAVAGLGALVAVAAIAAVLVGGGNASASARITDAELNGNTYTVWFETEGVTISANGDQLVFYWNNAAPATGATWAGGSPVSFTFQRPVGATKICIAVAPADGAIKTSSGNCWTV